MQATNITSTSAIISWLPSNSNFQHTVNKQVSNGTTSIVTIINDRIFTFIIIINSISGITIITRPGVCERRRSESCEARSLPSHHHRFSLRSFTPPSPSLSQSLDPPSSHIQTPNPHHQPYFITQNLSLRSKYIHHHFSLLINLEVPFTQIQYVSV